MLFFDDSLIPEKSKMQKCVTLSVAEYELMALNGYMQEMIHIKQLIVSNDLNVRLSMIIKFDNKKAQNSVNIWRIGSRTRYVGVNLNYLRELKEDGIFQSIGGVGHMLQGRMLTITVMMTEHFQLVRV
jgi:hypothetical protein